MFRYLALLALAITPMLCYADDQAPSKPEVDSAEVHRRGDYVTVVGEGSRGAADEAYTRAMAPPLDDSDKWFVSVFYDESDTSKKLLKDFDNDASLLAFVYAQEPYKPWAHYNVYNVKDATQKWRVDGFKVTTVPTIVVQPPRNGIWGSPRTVVFHSGNYLYQDPQALGTMMSSAVQQYVMKMSAQGYPRQPVSFSDEELNQLGTEVQPFLAPTNPQLNPQLLNPQSGSRQTIAQIPFQTPQVPYNPNPSVPSQVPQTTYPPQVVVQPNPPAQTGVLAYLMSFLAGAGGIALLKMLIDLWRPVAALTPSKLDDLAVTVADRLVQTLTKPQTVQSQAPAQIVITPAHSSTG